MLITYRLVGAVLCAVALSACAPMPVPSAGPSAPAPAAPTQPADEPLRIATQAEVPAFLKTLESLVAIESGSRDLEGLTRLSDVVADRLRQSGMEVELKTAKAPDFHPQLKGATMGRMV